MSLVTGYPNGRTSDLESPDWRSNTRVSLLNEDSVEPGEIGTFTLPLERFRTAAPLYFEGFRIAVQGVGVIASDYVYRVEAAPYREVYDWRLTSVTAYTDDTKTVEADLDNLVVGEPVYISVLVRNTGLARWFEGGEQFGIQLGTINPHGRISEFCDDSWNGCTRPTDLWKDIPSGASVRFEFWWVATQAGDFDERFGLVVDGLYWLPNRNLIISGTATEAP